jgi:hypothetical protein
VVPLTLENKPAAQSMQAVAALRSSSCFPGTHAGQRAEPVGEKVPSAQAVHWVVPLTLENKPAAQSTHCVLADVPRFITLIRSQYIVLLDLLRRVNVVLGASPPSKTYVKVSHLSDCRGHRWAADESVASTPTPLNSFERQSDHIPLSRHRRNRLSQLTVALTWLRFNP